MAGPFARARERFAENHPIAAAGIRAAGRAAAQEIIDDPSTGATAADAPAIERAVDEQVTPVLANATNSEPWYRSRIWVGLFTTIVGIIADRLGIALSPDEQSFLVSVAPQVVEGLGLAVAAIGRAVGNSRGPIVWSRPWTIFGIGR